MCGSGISVGHLLFLLLGSRDGLQVNLGRGDGGAHVVERSGQRVRIRLAAA